MNLDYAKIKEAAQNYQKDMTKFLREIVKNPGESCDEKAHITRIAEERGLTEAGTAEKILNVLNIYRLPHKCGLPLGSLTKAISLDKKNMHGTLNLVLLHNIGNSYAEPSSLQFFDEPKRMI